MIGSDFIDNIKPFTASLDYEMTNLIEVSALGVSKVSDTRKIRMAKKSRIFTLNLVTCRRTPIKIGGN